MQILPALLLALAQGLVFPSQPHPRDSEHGSAASLVAAELSFAAQADSENTRAAFLAVLDDDGVLFRPGPVNGKTWLTPRKADASKLSWHPSFVELSRDGDLGYSTGPYQWRAEAGSKEVAHGHFVSVWGRRGGVWKLLLDMGVSHPAPLAEIPLFKPGTSAGNEESVATGPASTDDLPGQEHAFSQAAKNHGMAAAYRRFAAVDLRFYRDGAFPLKELQAALQVAAANPGTATWICQQTRVSHSGDLGYSYGFTDSASGQKKRVFLHLWKRAQGGGWKLVLDLESPIPPEQSHS